MDLVTKWLLEQIGMFVIMGIVIYWLSRRLVKAENDKDKLSEDVIKLTTLWESKASAMGEEDRELKEKILNLLSEIRGMLK